MLASVAPVICSDVSAPFLEEVFATDASIHKGAIVKRSVDQDLAKILWLDGDKRGHYTRLDTPFRAILADIGEDFEQQNGSTVFPSSDKLLVSPEKPPCLSSTL